MKNLFFLSLGLVLFVTACEDVAPEFNINEPIPIQLISPSQADLLSDALIMPEGAQMLDGPVYPTSNGDEPTVTSAEYFLGANGATIPIQLSYTHTLPRLGGFYVEVKGASSYYKIPYKGPSTAAGEMTIPIGIPPTVDQGEFCLSFYVYDVAHEVSEATTSCISVIRLGTGSLQISLSWDNVSDLDLIVHSPKGETVHRPRPGSSNGGTFDREDADGFGPENIFWEADAPNGVYTVEVKDNGGCDEVSNFIVTVNCNGVFRTFTGSSEHGEKVNAVTFTKIGNEISF